MKKKWIGWKSFHNQLDMAIVTWVKEGSPSRFPGDITLLQFMYYCELKKKDEGEMRRK